MSADSWAIYKVSHKRYLLLKLALNKMLLMESSVEGKYLTENVQKQEG